MNDQSGDNEGGKAAGCLSVIGAFLLGLMKCSGKGAVKGGASMLTKKIVLSSAIKGVTASVGAHEGIHVVALEEAQTVLSATTRHALSSQPYLFERTSMPGLYNRYPDLADVTAHRMQVDTFLKNNPKFLDDASVSLYEKDPKLFANELSKQRILHLDSSAFDSVLTSNIQSKNEAEFAKIADGTTRRMRRDGYTPDALRNLDDAKVHAIVEKYVERELAGESSTSHRWAYKSGKLVVSGKAGNFEYEQEVSVEWVVKASMVSVAAVGGKRLVWDKSEFHKDNRCLVSDLCEREDAVNPEAATPGRDAVSVVNTKQKLPLEQHLGLTPVK
jgi:hypothetical protein